MLDLAAHRRRLVHRMRLEENSGPCLGCASSYGPVSHDNACSRNASKPLQKYWEYWFWGYKCILNEWTEKLLHAESINKGHQPSVHVCCSPLHTRRLWLELTPALFHSRHGYITISCPKSCPVMMLEPSAEAHNSRLRGQENFSEEVTLEQWFGEYCLHCEKQNSKTTWKWLLDSFPFFVTFFI